MKLVFACAVAIVLGGSLSTVLSQAPDLQAPNPDRLYHIGPDSMACLHNTGRRCLRA